MRMTTVLTVASLLFASAALVACGGAGRSDAGTTAEMPAPAGAPATTPVDVDASARADATISGDLLLVDLQKHTFTVRSDSGVDHLFTFSDATDVTGAPGVQSLGGMEGAAVTIHFTRTFPSTGSITATKIELR